MRYTILIAVIGLTLVTGCYASQNAQLEHENAVLRGNAQLRQTGIQPSVSDSALTELKARVDRHDAQIKVLGKVARKVVQPKTYHTLPPRVKQPEFETLGEALEALDALDDL